MDLKEGLSGFLSKLEELETAARKLPNQNFADVTASAKGRVQQLIDHADLELVHKEMFGVEEQTQSKPQSAEEQPPTGPALTRGTAFIPPVGGEPLNFGNAPGIQPPVGGEHEEH